MENNSRHSIDNWTVDIFMGNIQGIPSVVANKEKIANYKEILESNKFTICQFIESGLYD